MDKESQLFKVNSSSNKKPVKMEFINYKPDHAPAPKDKIILTQTCNDKSKVKNTLLLIAHKNQ